jgi:hypothetical protein
MFEDEMQNKLDQLFTNYVADLLPSNKTARLAFAAAACKRLLPGDNGAKNASLFSPFVYAALVRTQVFLEEEKRTPERIRKEWEQSLNKTDKQLVEAEQKPEDVFLGLVAQAYHADSEMTESGQRAPSILQQVALCANVEQQLVSTQQLNSTELKERTWTACGKAVVSATNMGQGLPDATDPVLAQQAIEQANSDRSASTWSDEPGIKSAAAWRQAMEAVLAASIPKPQARPERLCQRIRSSVATVSCDPRGDGEVILDFNASFAIGKTEDRTLELQIARLADMLDEDRQAYVFAVYGYASASTYSCGQSSARTSSPCGAEKNHALAKARAMWALGVLRKRLQEHFSLDSHADGLFNPVSFDSPSDRRIRIMVSLRN